MWSFLDKMDKNLLYQYAQVVSGKQKAIRTPKSDRSTMSEYDELKLMESIRNRAYYLIWFVYRYVLDCKTLEEALQYADEDTLKRYHLFLYVYGTQNDIYIGVDKEICFNNHYRYKEDIIIVLEILYNRYDLFEQMECFIRHSKNLRQTRCRKALERYKEMYNRIKENEK